MEETEFNIAVLPLRDKMFRFARSILLRSDLAEDVTHDTLERMWLRRERLGECLNVEAFVMTSLRNGCYDYLRRRRVRISDDDGLQSIAVSDSSGQWSDRELVRAAMARLPQGLREVLHLKDIEGYQTREVAEMTRTGEAQIRVVLSRARKRLRDEVVKIMDYGTKN